MFGTPYLDGKPARPVTPRYQTPPVSATKAQPQTVTNPNNVASSHAGESQDFLEPLPETNGRLSGIRHALNQRRVSVYYAFGMKYPYETCLFNHGQSGLRFYWYGEVISSNDGKASIAAYRMTNKEYDLYIPDGSL